MRFVGQPVAVKAPLEAWPDMQRNGAGTARFPTCR